MTLRSTFVAATLLIAPILPQPMFAASGDNAANPGILPPNSSPHGASYAQWNARWWQWFISLTTSPFDACSTGQSGKVWFLAGEAGTLNPPVYCTVPTGTMLFFPLINTECSNVESPPFYGATEADRRACAKAIADGAADLQLTVDGKVAYQLESYRSSSTEFAFNAPSGNIAGMPVGPGISVADGYYVMLAPLSVGSHTIHFSAAFPAFSFSIDTTYVITVAK